MNINILYLNGETTSDIIQELLATDKMYVNIRRDKLLGLLKEPVEGYLNSNNYKLSSRENEILYLVSQGLSNKDISNLLFISSNTVRNHMYNIFKKLNVNDRAQAVAVWKNVSRETF